MSDLVGRLINVGCGEFPLPPPWENFDITVVPSEPGRTGTVLKADALEIHYRDAEMVYSGHMLEHLTLGDARKFLRRVREHLPTGSILVVTVPTIDRMRDVGTLEEIQDFVLGGRRWPGDEHKSIWRTSDIMIEMMRAGFRDISEWPDFKWLVSRVSWQVCLKGVK